ncbi:efflux transporter outer membrane subunit [Novosphingobium decolorationis]|uniref:Efflux transporter outer membrane subunit n=1 Tax=Novosphingobium decolorationis TaxID=2698673 RepID=A0ABX8E685_9SPHN|nr:efflux transporter outer membrane subunit [Novosphingobium decolorationis]QVM83726.1 efflux transporter outer membrane subunit [Novosphingobium decolorationis]
MTSLRSALPTLSTLAALVLTSGCAVTRRPYEAPVLPTQEAFSFDQPGSARSADAPWWNEFADPQLTALVDQVLAANADLAAAGIRLRQARENAALTRWNQAPTLDASASSSASKALSGNSAWDKSSGLSLGASWEVDLFGKLDAQADAARWEADATQQDLAATRLALIGTTASAWWQLGLANEQVAIGEQSLAYLQKLLQLVQRQYDAGAVSRLELRDAQQSVAAQQASLTQLRQTRVEVLKAIAALLGQQDYTGPELTRLPERELPAIAPGVPSTLLARRPDLAAAELRLRETLATSDATVASYLPSFSLTGALGTASSALLGFVSNPAASLGAALSAAELNPEKIRLGTSVARAEYDAAREDLRQTFYDALRDTEIALSARNQYIAQGTALDANYLAAMDAEELYERQYRVGYIPLRDLLDAQERLRTARSSLIQNRYDKLSAQIAVYQALGGDPTS